MEMSKKNEQSQLAGTAEAPAAGPVKAFKRWEADDLQDLSLERDLAATGKLCELLGLCSSDAARGFRKPFEQMAELGYAGYCYYDFASVSMRGLFDVHADLLHEELGPDFHATYIWNWTSKFLNARTPGSKGGVRMMYKNAAEPRETDTFFARFLRFDDKYGVEEGETTVTRFARDLSAEFDAAHPGVQGMPLPCKDIVILMIMDQLDQMDSQPRFEKLTRRVPIAHAFTEVQAGRWLPGGRVGHLWLNTNRSMGMEGISGLENERWVIGFGAALMPS
jgi:hypothetical protein